MNKQVTVDRELLERIESAFSSGLCIPHDSAVRAGIRAALAAQPERVKSVAYGDIAQRRDQLQARLDAMGKGEPVAWQFRTNGKHWHVVQVCPPDDAYDKGTLSPLYAAPKALAPLTDKEDWDVRGILASKLRVFHRTTEAEAEELISLFSSMKSRTPLTQPEVVEAFCNTPHNVQYVSVFDAGVRFAEKHHGIGGTP